MSSESQSEEWPDGALAKIASLQSALTLTEDALLQERERAKLLEAERDRLRAAYQEMLVAIELLRRRIEAAKAERVDVKQLELEFEAKRKELEALAGKLGEPQAAAPDGSSAPPPSRPRNKPAGRRDLADDASLPEERIEVDDPEMERLVAEGKAQRFGFDDESSKVRHRRASKVRLVIVRVKYRLGKLEGVEGSTPGLERRVDTSAPGEAAAASSAPAGEVADSEVAGADAIATVAAAQAAGSDAMATLSASGPPAALATTQDVAQSAAASDAAAPARIDRSQGTTLVTAQMPPSIVARSIGTPSLFANIIYEKLGRGMPLFRQEERLALDGFPLGRGTMCRWAQEIGQQVGKTVVAAMWAEAKSTAFCLATDATGVLVQPAPREDGKRQACKRGHFFAVIADRDHVLFDYTPREDSNAVMRMFRGYAGYVQADAKSVFNVLFREPDDKPPDDPDLAPDGAERQEVGCWSHARRRFFECAVTSRDVVAREALWRIHRLFEHEQQWRKLAPAQRKTMRYQVSRPELAVFFAWAELEYRKVEHQRGLLRSALGYVRNQKDALLRYLDDGRLEMDNNRTERQIKLLVLGRKAWLFIGSDDHGRPTANLLSLVASCKLHGLDPETYLRDLFCVLPQWPADRYLELAPKYWRATRARLSDAQLDREIAWFTIPSPLEIPAAPTPASPQI